MTIVGEVTGRHRFVVGRSPAALELVWAARTDVGLRRAVNEDSLVAMPGMLAVADGLGGHSAGDRASAAVVRRLGDAAKRRARRGGVLEEADTDRALLRAGSDIVAETVGVKYGSGTTVSGVAVVSRDGRPALLVFNIGDSRVYRFDRDRLEQITIDHSLVQELVAAGRLRPEDAESHPESNVITRAIGFGGDVIPDRWLLRPSAGMRLLACSDGLTKELDGEHIAAILGAGLDAAGTADALVAASLEAGGRDNVTVVVIDVLVAPEVDNPAPATTTAEVPRSPA